MAGGGWMVVYSYIMGISYVQILMAISYTILPLVMVSRLIGGTTVPADSEDD